ncbi:MAG: PspA/IM30 family protein [Balneolaceae bacterium]
MFNRFIRAIKSLFGGVVQSMENPRLILEQNIRELNDQIPRMNENIATVKANVIMLRKEVERYEKTINDIVSKIKSAINADRDDLAEGYALQLEKARENLQHSQEQLKFADKAYEKAQQVKKAFMREKDKKIKEARDALKASERAEWQARVADALESFEMGGLDQTHHEMVGRLNEEAARNEARMEIALDGVDTETMEIEANAEKLRAKELVNQFKTEMGKSGAEAEPTGIDTPEESSKEEGESAKSVGRERTREE